MDSFCSYVQLSTTSILRVLTDKYLSVSVYLFTLCAYEVSSPTSLYVRSYCRFNFESMFTSIHHTFENKPKLGTPNIQSHIKSKSNCVIVNSSAEWSKHTELYWNETNNRAQNNSENKHEHVGRDRKALKIFMYENIGKWHVQIESEKHEQNESKWNKKFTFWRLCLCIYNYGAMCTLLIVSIWNIFTLKYIELNNVQIVRDWPPSLTKILQINNTI
jgi:hypothetical protein